MAFEPKTWVCGDTITAQELNRMEQGIEDASQDGGGSSSFIVHGTVSDENITVAENVEDIVNAIEAEQNVYMITVDSDNNQSYLYLHCYVDAEYNDGVPIIDFRSIVSLYHVDNTVSTELRQIFASYDGNNIWYYKTTISIINQG